MKPTMLDYARMGGESVNPEAFKTSEPEPPVEAVTVAYVHQNNVTYSWHHSMVEMIGYDLSNSGRIMAGGYIAMRCGSDGLVEARNKAVRHFLEDKPSDWFFWIDTDMGFEPDVIDRLLDAADPVERPIVGALCFSMRETHSDEMGGWRVAPVPTVFDWAHLKKVKDEELTEEMGFAVRWDYPLNTVVRCTGTGSACVLIHRSVFERIEAEHGPVWYNKVPNPSTGQIVSEDLSFCLRAGALNIPLHIHTGVRTTHMKPLWVAEEDYWAHRAVTPTPGTVDEHNRQVEEGLCEPERDWTVPRYAIVPTHNRPARLLALVSSLGSQCDTIVVLDNASDPPVDEAKLGASVPEHCSVEVIRDEEQPPNLARFWNVMFHRCRELMRNDDVYDVAVFNDDSIVPAGWYSTVATALREHPTAVIGHTSPTFPALLTELHNDPGNRMCPHAFVIRGELGLRADEDMRWWYFDTDFDWWARQAGGVLSVPGPRVANSLANSTTCGVLAEQAEKDRATFEAKWSR